MNACHSPSKSLVGTPSETPATIPLYLGCVTYGRGAGLQKLAGQSSLRQLPNSIKEKAWQRQLVHVTFRHDCNTHYRD